MRRRINIAVLSACLSFWASPVISRPQAQKAAENQRLTGAAPGIPVKASAAIWKAQDAIYQAHPSLETRTIEQDKVELGKAYQTVWLQAGAFHATDADTGKLLATVWADYRTKNPSAAFDSSKVVELAKGYGGLHVKTSPIGASVWVDGKQWDGLTEMTAFARAGKRKIRVGGLTGYQDEEGGVNVEPSKITDFEKILIKLK